MMVGREVLLRVEKTPAQPRDVVLRVEGLTAHDDRGHLTVDDVSFEVQAGEVLGVAGVQGNGQTELVEVLTGLREASGGKVQINGQDLTNASPRAVTSIGTGHVPEDRHRFGMVDSYTVAENLVLNTYHEAPFGTAPSMRMLPVVSVVYGALALGVFAVLALIWQAIWNAAVWPGLLGLFGIADAASASRDELDGPILISMLVLIALTFLFGFIAHRAAIWVMSRIRRAAESDGVVRRGLALDHDAIDRHAAGLVEQFDIRTPSVSTSGGSLSGGNQQKMVVAREFGRRPRLLIASQPTRGIDVGSIEFIHQQIVSQRDAGAAVLLVSAELDEITALSDRIVVMYKGQAVATVEAASVTREQLGLLMAGASAEDVLKGSVAAAA
jgi:ABC-type uncharacterized transport system ATPase subunit